MNATTVIAAALVCAVATGSARAGQVTSPLLIDRGLTVGAGATISTTIGAAVARAEHAVVPDRLFNERGPLRRSGNVTYRLVKFAFFDLPQEQLVLVANHELFGHGARLRERFDGPIGYRIGLPPPYGRGGGSTSFVFDREPAPYERLAIHAGGMEASSVAAGLIAQRAFTDGMRPRDALRYLMFELDTLAYIWSTDDEGEEPGHDVADFLDSYNRAIPPGAHELTPRMLRREAVASLANPMLVFAVHGIARYLWNGDTGISVPALSIAGVRYLPMVRYRLAPYGTEWSLVNELGGRIRPTQIELRVGRSTDASPWAAAVRRRDLTTWRGWRMGASVEVWQQPRLADIPDGVLAGETQTGIHVNGRAERSLIPVWFSGREATVIIDIGVKAAGFVPGEPLGRGVVARAGIGLPLDQ